MIHDLSRKGYFGASDTHKYVMNDNRFTKTWQKWWKVKIGLIENDFIENKYTKAGNTYEHSILKSIDKEMQVDDQHIIEDLLLRVNYDGILNDTIYEVKCHDISNELKKDSESAYWMQVQVQMWCYKQITGVEPKAYIVEYKLVEEDYSVEYSEEEIESGTIQIDEDRRDTHPIKYNEKWVEKKYLPKLKKLADRLREETNEETA